MPSANSIRLRSVSVSSIRRMKTPPSWRANSQLNRAVRPLPTWKYPVGEGAKRTRGALTGVEGSAGSARNRAAQVDVVEGDGAGRGGGQKCGRLGQQALGVEAGRCHLLH